jgi:hypothetical protein
MERENQVDGAVKQERKKMRHNGKRKTEHKQCSFKTIQISVEAHHMLGAVAAQLMQPIGRTVESFAISWARHIGVEAQVRGRE